MVTTTLEIPQFPLSNLMTIYPTPPPFSSHAFENNDVTSIMTRNACQNKELTSQTLSEIGYSCGCLGYLPAPRSISRVVE